MKQDNPFAKLGALDQKLYQETTPPLPVSQVPDPEIQEFKKTRIQENQNTSNKEYLNTSNPDIKIARNPEIQKTAKREFFTKATYRLCDEALDAIEDAKKMLKRQYELKVNLEEIVETAVLEAYKDLTQKKEKSSLVIKYSGNPENKNSR